MMYKALILLTAALGGCAFNGHIIKTCPGDTRLVAVTQSRSTNKFLARASEEARAMVKCARLELEED